MPGNIIVNGTITCTPDDVEMVVAGLRDHVRLTREEPGCISFSIEQSAADPCVFTVSERFADKAAFDAHGKRTRAAAWWEMSQHIPRDLKITEE